MEETQVNLRMILLIVAVILFVVAAIWRGDRPVDLQAAGLAFFAGAFLV
jgi:hypothetical protein